MRARLQDVLDQVRLFYHSDREPIRHIHSPLMRHLAPKIWPPTLIVSPPTSHRRKEYTVCRSPVMVSILCDMLSVKTSLPVWRSADGSGILTSNEAPSTKYCQIKFHGYGDCFVQKLQGICLRSG